MLFLVSVRHKKCSFSTDTWRLCYWSTSWLCFVYTAAVFTTIVPTSVLDFIKRIMTVISPNRQMNKATPRQTAEIRADSDSELPIYNEFYTNTGTCLSIIIYNWPGILVFNNDTWLTTPVAITQITVLYGKFACMCYHRLVHQYKWYWCGWW